ncbi:hypothetical protein SAMN04488066_104214 [Halorubrum aquaticum]|uniref:Uncharacterized protein n=1 Tax=Halorubrum aquaticum TaxID=387340 RepID=A0A1I3A6N8_9EURY|nr:hypothetical protein [Halorubrum aquaticum]SFH45777.1 hypothetical protein SAMN04488066_104214 [Halorubrum aquaticum]
MSRSEPPWPDGMDAAARVRHVALTRTEPRNAGWIAEEAAVSRDTAVKYLERMVDRGDLEAVETATGTGYKPDGVTQFLREVRRLAEEHTVDELTRELNAIGDEIDEWKATYEVDSLAELRGTVGRDDLTAAERRDRMEIVEEWEYDIEVRESIRLAISLQNSMTTLGGDPRFDDSTTLPQEG